jgi:hypothetical protein
LLRLSGNRYNAYVLARCTMTNDYTEIAFVLDRSGSMQLDKDAAIDGFNRFLREQQQTDGLAKLTLVFFGDEYLVPVCSIRVQEVPPLSRETYGPRGDRTALLDAIGRTIDDLNTRIASLHEDDRPAQVIVAILTDGIENASEKFSWDQLAATIKRHTEEYRWTFLFLGANQDALATAARLNIAESNAATYAGDAAGSRASHASVSRKVRGLRLTNMGTADPQATMDATATMSQIVEEEDRKERS